MAGFTFPMVLLAASISLALACSPTADWKSKSLEERARLPMWIVYGTVMSPQMPINNLISIDQVYQVVFQPLCWLKTGRRNDSDDGPDTSDDDAPQTGDAGHGHDDDHDHLDGIPDDIPDDIFDGIPDYIANFTFGPVGFLNLTVRENKIDCVANDLKEGEEYILFLGRMGKDQFTIVDVNVESGAIMNPEDSTFEEVHRGIDAGMKGDPKGKCLPGVEIACFTGTKDDEVCSKAVNMGVATWFIIASAIMAAMGL